MSLFFQKPAAAALRNAVLLVGLLAVFFLAGCAQRGSGPQRFGLTDSAICQDLDLLPQDLTVYAARAGADKTLMDRDRQMREDMQFNQRFFAAWEPDIKRPPAREVFEATTALKPAAGFAENLRPWDPVRWQSLIDTCRKESYGSGTIIPLITVGATPLRRLPTDAPFFLSPERAGEGFPFDYLQNSVLWPGTPAAGIHSSRDGQWVYVHTGLVSGWARAKNLARVDTAFIEAWRARPLAVIVEDSLVLPVIGGASDAVTGMPRTLPVWVGTLLPCANPGPAPQGTVRLLAPLRGTNGMAVATIVAAPATAALPKPLPLTPGAVARVGNAMMGQPYGWGGMFAQRDCSSAMHDLFAAFGLWLPRNSRPQGLMGRQLPLEGLSPAAKEERISQEGLPFFSLVSMPGHIGLYLGTYPLHGRDVPVMFHSIWGLRLRQGEGETAREGRAIIGKAVVTSLRPGAEHATIATPASLLDRIKGLAVLPDPLEGDPQAGSAL